MKLWELSDEIAELDNAISAISDDETIDDEQKERLLNELFSQYLESDEQFTQKAVNVAEYVNYLENLAELRKQEIKRLNTLKVNAENQAKRLRGYLVTHMTRTNKKKIEGVNCKLSLRKKPPTLKINCDVDDLPEEYQIIDRKPNRTLIKQFIKENGDRSWAFMKDSDEYSLIIK